MIWLDRAAGALTLILPLFLLHGRGIAELVLALIAAGFLVQAALRHDWAWLGRGWLRVALAWWAWLVLCSARHGWDSFGQAAGVVRFLLLAAALESWTLRTRPMRAWLASILRWSAFYIALQSLLQFASGRNLYGWPRGAAGELTGPYKNPRAGPPLSRLLFPAVLPLTVRWMARPAWQAVGGILLLPAAVTVMVLTGQRMPLLLTILGLFVTALLVPRLRALVLYSCVGASLLIGATQFIAPRTFERLVVTFSAQLENFPESAYGQIYARSWAIAQNDLLLGDGFDGFRRDCDDPRHFHGWHGGDGGGAAICVQHPHNFYIQALVEAGIPGLILFAGMAAAMLLRLSAGLWRNPDPLRVGLLVAALIQLWPIASTTAFTSMPLNGYFFVLLGLGLAETRHYMNGPSERST